MGIINLSGRDDTHADTLRAATAGRRSRDTTTARTRGGDLVNTVGCVVGNALEDTLDFVRNGRASSFNKKKRDPC